MFDENAGVYEMMDLHAIMMCIWQAARCFKRKVIGLMFLVWWSGQVEIYKNRQVLFYILAGDGKAGISVYFCLMSGRQGPDDINEGIKSSFSTD